MEYQVSFPRRIAKQGEVTRVGGGGPRNELRVGYELDLDNLLRVGGVNLDAAAADPGRSAPATACRGGNAWQSGVAAAATLGRSGLAKVVAAAMG